MCMLELFTCQIHFNAWFIPSFHIVASAMDEIKLYDKCIWVAS